MKTLLALYQPKDNNQWKLYCLLPGNRAIYAKSSPIHHSQTFVKERNDRTYFKYLLVPTYDFFQEILWHGQAVKVEYPEVLVKQIEYELKNA